MDLQNRTMALTADEFKCKSQTQKEHITDEANRTQNYCIERVLWHIEERECSNLQILNGAD
jgi:hypothetical protein